MTKRAIGLIKPIIACYTRLVKQFNIATSERHALQRARYRHRITIHIANVYVCKHMAASIVNNAFIGSLDFASPIVRVRANTYSPPLSTREGVLSS
jgi:hypothetical protein